MLALAADLCLAIAGLGILYLALAIVMVIRPGGAERPPERQPSERKVLPSVTLLKPLHGASPTLRDNLISFLQQDYPGSVHIVCGVQGPADPAIGVVEGLQAAFPETALDLVVDPTLHGSNRKVSNLVNMSGHIRGDIVVLSDDDMRVPADYLTRVVDALQPSGIGAVTCLYHGIAGGNAWSELARLGVDTHFLPSVAVGLGLGMASPCFGSTIAIGAVTLTRIGGFAMLADQLADDYVLGDRVRGLGLKVAVPPFTIGHVSSEVSLRDVVRQDLRWARTIRQIDPLGHAGSGVSHPFAFALAALCLAPNQVTLGVAATAVLLRLGVCLAVERRFGLRRHPYWMGPVRDLLSFGVFAASFAGRGVTWRGQAYGVTPAGTLVAKSEP